MVIPLFVSVTTELVIPEKDIAHIFDLRYRASNTKNINGSGIGLYLVKKVLESCGGSINVESAPYKGSQFIIRLPILEDGLEGRVIELIR